MSIGGAGYWVAVGALLVAVGIGHSLYVARLKARGYWVPHGDGVLLPIVIVVILAAMGVAQVFGD